LITTAQTIEASSSAKTDHSALIVFIALCFLEFISFGPALRQAGVYLDEWIYFQNLHFAGPSFSNSLFCLLNDPRIIVRPFEALHFGLLYALVHEKPFLYHFVNQLCEISGAWFFYQTVTAVSANKRLGFMTAVFFLLYPSHDSTHYSIVASSISMSLTLFLFSCWQFVLGLKNNQAGRIWIAATAYVVSIFNYELCLPLVIVYPVLTLLMNWKNSTLSRKYAVLVQIPFFASVIAMTVYRSKILPALHLGWGYRSIFAPSQFIHILIAGMGASLSPYAFITFGQMALRELKERDILLVLLILIPTVAITTISMRLMALQSGNKGTIFAVEKIDLVATAAIVCGGIIILASYSIYGCSPDYMPALTSCLNRVNAGGSIGAALVLAGFIETIIQGFATPWLAAPMASFFVVLFTLTNWQFARPWLTSWQAQKQIQTIIRQKANLFTGGHVVLLANVPRYVDWAPVYDGVWDFQSTCRVLLNDQNISAGVISPRMSVTKNYVVDKVGNVICGKYPIKGMLVLVPSPATFIPIRSAQEFIEVAHKYNVDVSDQTGEAVIK
jgi:hypothetical protein